MIRRRVAGALLLLAAAPSAGARARHPVVLNQTLTLRELETLEAYALALANRNRAAHRLPPLAADPLITAAARQHSDEMRDRRYFSHESPEPRFRTWVLRLARAGVTDATSGENIATYGSNHRGATLEQFVERLEDDLMHSPKHRANLLNPKFNTAGIGLAIGESSAASSPAVPLPTMWITQDFAGRRLRLDGAVARASTGSLAVTLSGALLVRGALRVFVHPAAGSDTSEAVTVTGGRFSHTVRLAAAGGRVRLDLGVGSGRESFEIANRLAVDTNARPEEAVTPWLEDE